jgi:hypothetical protein
VRAYLLGAGASAHAGYPLIKHLGTVLVEWAAGNPHHGIDADELHARFPSLEDFEQIISELERPAPGSAIDQLPEDKRGSILAGVRETLCEYFDILRLNHAPLYRQFAEEVCSPGDTVITFNYDVSLEAELRKAKKWHIGDGYGFHLGVSVTPASPVRVLKLHGSTSWIDILFDGARGGDYRTVGPDGPLGARPLIPPQYFDFFGYPPQIVDPRFEGGGSSRSGSMILPARSKVFDERGRFWDHLWLQASETLGIASEIVIIGYSLAPTDERARKLVLQGGYKDASITVCCGEDNIRIANELTDAGFAAVRAESCYFDDWLNSLRAERTQ